MSPPSSRYTGASRADSSLGGGDPVYTAAAGGVHGARALPDAIPTAIDGRLSCCLIVGFPSVVSTAVSGQIGFLSSRRSRRNKHHHKWSLYLGLELSPTGGHGALVLYSVGLSRGRRNASEPLGLGWTARIRTKIAL
jgi:hypothetical protein